MADRLPEQVAGKAWRVLGVFMYMLGAGVLLESHARWLGTVILLSGVATLAWGARVGRVVGRATAITDRLQQEGRPTEGRI